MATPRKTRLVTSLDQAVDNIVRYNEQLESDPGLQEVMSYARAWYAHRTDDGRWMLAPGKFVGYQIARHGPAYPETHGDRDGRRTERALSEWFKPMESGSALFEELASVLKRRFADHDRTPNRLLRIHVSKAMPDLSERRVARSAPHSPAASRLDRVTTDPAVCSGRPCIRGMRVRVSDILDLLAAGATRDQILADFPYLEDEDIGAALEYAARSVGHRVIRAA